MAYTADEWLFQVRGTVSDSETWNNTWCLFDDTGGQPPQEAADILAALYEDWYGFASWISAAASVTGCSAKNLSGGVPTEMTGFSFTGSAPSPLLPSQIAMRVSLSGTGGTNGGPFIAGLCTTAVDGAFIDTDCVGDFVGALETFTNSLTTAGWSLRINRPTTETTAPLIQGRVGRRFDVIRKRANELAEAYTMFEIA